MLLFGSDDPVVPVIISVARINASYRPNIVTRVIDGADYHMNTSMEPKAQMDPGQTILVKTDAPEYFSKLISWLTHQGFARPPQ